MKLNDKRLQKNHNWNGYEEISGAYWTNIKSNAKKRGLIMNITKQEAWNIFLAQNRKCFFSGVEIYFTQNWTKRGQTASLDRIDTSLGYIFGNIRWVHKCINSMRIRLSDDEFITWCRLVTETNIPILEASRNLK